MVEVIEVEDRYYILAGSALADSHTLVLKHDETFGVFGVTGDIEAFRSEAHGLFTGGMRYISKLETTINGQRPLLLSSRVTNDNTRIIIDLTNPDMADHGAVSLAHGTLHLSRSRFLWANAMFEKLTLSNYALHPVEVTVTVRFDADFTDIFEVRGMERKRRGQRLAPVVENDRVTFTYQGLDNIERRAVFAWSPPPDILTANEAHFIVEVPTRERTELFLTVRCEPLCTARSNAYTDNARRLLQFVDNLAEQEVRIDSSTRALTEWIRRSAADIRMLLTETNHGLYPYAGVPWYSTPFGRDGIITALQTLWFNPDIARGVLLFLSTTQAREHDPSRDAEPGRILHEWRIDEMANIGEVPFGRYYGSVDATPLFVVLASAYYNATGDRALIELIWPNIESALNWIDRFGDLDQDGFVEYQSKAEDGLFNQGWKDSHDAIFHADGSIAELPIALCEVQGYVYDAKLRASELAALLGRRETAERLAREAAELKVRFNKAFWLDDLNTYALALDGRKRPCAVRASNAGHCLFSGIADREYAQKVVRVLMSSDMFCGWGVQTVASTEARFNPMSYHNGSVWPHDNAIIAAGMMRYGFRDEALQIFNSWFNASRYLDVNRLPELICGFCRHRGKGPTLYPVACSPQAWAAGTVFMLLGACLGLCIDGPQRQIRVHRPRLPHSVDQIRIRGLRIGNETIDLLFHRERKDIGVLVLRKEGSIDLVLTK